MVAFQPRLPGLELQTTQYDYAANGTPEKRYLITAWVPIPADGRVHGLYRRQDHYLLPKLALTQTTIGRDSMILRNH